MRASTFPLFLTLALFALLLAVPTVDGGPIPRRDLDKVKSDQAAKIKSRQVTRAKLVQAARAKLSNPLRRRGGGPSQVVERGGGGGGGGPSQLFKRTEPSPALPRRGNGPSPVAPRDVGPSPPVAVAKRSQPSPTPCEAGKVKADRICPQAAGRGGSLLRGCSAGSGGYNCIYTNPLGHTSLACVYDSDGQLQTGAEPDCPPVAPEVGSNKCYDQC